MPIGYLGFLKLADQFLLCNSTGLNRQVNPLLSTGVWGAGWFNAATTTNYADSQQHFEGAMNFELQGEAAIWNLIRDWLIQQRAFPQNVILSPNGIVTYNYLIDGGDPRTGVWMSQAAITVDSTALITFSATGIALKRVEVVASTNWKVGLKTNVGAPVKPLNPSPRNRNPIPGWNTQALVTWPNAPAFWADPGALDGMVLTQANFTVNNNTQIVRGCTGDTNPVAVIQGTITVDGTMNLWRDGGIPDPYVPDSNFTAENASVIFDLGGAPALTFRMRNILLTSDAHDVQGQNTLTSRNFGMAGLGDGVFPPFLMDLAV